MSKHLTGSKRLAVIHKWLNGRDDPDWEVLPTKTKDKYIVKQRKTPITREYQENSDSENNEDTQENSDSEEHEELEEKPRKPISSKAARKPTKPRKTQQSQVYDPTVNEEILKQLKSLGEEMKISREKKEQRRMIKEVVDKRMSKPRQQYVPEEPPQQYEEEQQPQYIPMRPIGRRNRIFEDMM